MRALTTTNHTIARARHHKGLAHKACSDFHTQTRADARGILSPGSPGGLMQSDSQSAINMLSPGMLRASHVRA